ncbi:hypothetical protein DFH08DRAFT_902896 [Mycena albidolilacea]|uniref:F-box domain-containing protein n=1 Tax=Mycena albidolilacea TaxID=1033008 RepID=A0AAD6Z363_9AGAR|nr:hypothetical protein DFH08DRAFT_902896 [Mycena albidolilacea]
MATREKFARSQLSLRRRISALWSSKIRNMPTAEPVLPTDVFREIANYLPRTDILALSSCSIEMRTLLLPDVYAAVSLLCGSSACSSKLELLSASPHWLAYVKKLEIGPDWLSWPIDELVELRVASTVVKISPRLTNLETFTWCGIYPLQEIVWRALRTSCPKLKILSYTAQTRQFEPDSELFKFRNLLSFSLCVKEKAEAFPLIKPNLPPKFCDMLLHSPDLEHLNLQLCPSHNNLGSLSSLMQRTWDNLSALQIEVCPDHPARDLIAPFLAAHPLITSLSILPHVPDILPLTFPPGTLPYLKFFSGISQHLAALPNLEHLRNLVLLDEPARNPLASTVGRLTFLTSLTITLADAGDMSLVFSITSACCLLESLAISYRTPCNMKQLKVIAVALRELPYLRELSLTKTYRLSDGTMLAAVLLLLEQNTMLREVHLIWVSTKEWKQSGDYTITPRKDDPRVPYVLNAKEFGPSGLGRLGGSFVRRFRHALDGSDRVSRGLARIRR